MRIRHPLGRGGRLWLSERLEAAGRAAELLEEKKRVLVREQRRLAVLERASRNEWDSAWREAQTWVARAVALRGERIIPAATPAEPASVRCIWGSSMGAYYPTELSCRARTSMAEAEATGTAAAPEATRAFCHALESGVHHAANVRALQEVERELRATLRRSRMLQHQMIPGLADSLRRLDLDLEQRERDDVLYARQAQDRRTT